MFLFRGFAVVFAEDVPDVPKVDIAPGKLGCINDPIQRLTVPRSFVQPSGVVFALRIIVSLPRQG
jgi:hypothetical protein